MNILFLTANQDFTQQWKRLAKEYSEITGGEVRAITAPYGSYEEILEAEMKTEKAPSLFLIKGCSDFEKWKEYFYDLSESKIYKELMAESYAIMDGEKVCGVATSVEAYGVIVNKKLLSKAGYNIEDISSLASLKTVVEDISSRTDELGFSAFTTVDDAIDEFVNSKAVFHLGSSWDYDLFIRKGLKSDELGIVYR